MSGITTHVLDTAHGRPAAGVAVRLEAERDGAWVELGAGATDDDGRLATLLPAGEAPAPGVYRLTFDTGAYFERTGRGSFYPQVAITFRVAAAEHHHVPLLLSPFGYSTYRGS